MKVQGIVIKGNKQAKRIGFPTANIKINPTIEPGIYRGYTEIDGKSFLSAIYVGGYRPDILETHLIDFSGDDFYGKEIKLEIQEKIREDKAGLSDDELKEQIALDIEQVIKSSS